MIPLPGALGGTDVVAWRLQPTKHLSTWQTAEGAFLVGGRWSPAGRRVIYASLDPATSILELAVHQGFATLDTVRHTLLELDIVAPGQVHVVKPVDVPNANWLRPGTVGAGQQAFGAQLLDAHPLVLIPSVVSTHSWNLLSDANRAQGFFNLRSSEALALDPRLNPAAAP